MKNAFSIILLLCFNVLIAQSYIDQPKSTRISAEKLDDLSLYDQSKTNFYLILHKASDTKDRWLDKKRPKNGTGFGSYAMSDSYIKRIYIEGNWINYTLEGPFKKIYKGIPIFEGTIKDGKLINGVAYGYEYVYGRITQSHISQEEKDDFRANIMGTHIAPFYQGTFQVGYQSGDKTVYEKLEGIDYSLTEGNKGIYAHYAVKGSWKKNGTGSNYVLQPDGMLHYYGNWKNNPLPLKVSIPYVDNNVDGMVISQGNEGRVVEAPFENNNPKENSQLVIKDKSGAIVRVVDNTMTQLVSDGSPQNFSLTYAGWFIDMSTVDKAYRIFSEINENVVEETRINIPNYTHSMLQTPRVTLDWEGGTYIGEAKNGIPNGWGKLYGVYPRAQYMEGNFINGKLTGYSSLTSVGTASRGNSIGFKINHLELYKDGKSIKAYVGRSQEDFKRDSIEMEREKAIAIQKRKQEEQKINDQWYNNDTNGNKIRRKVPGKAEAWTVPIYAPTVKISNRTYIPPSHFYVRYDIGTEKRTGDKYVVANSEKILLYGEYPNLWFMSVLVNSYDASNTYVQAVNKGEYGIYVVSLENEKIKVPFILFSQDDGSSIVAKLTRINSTNTSASVTVKMIKTFRPVDSNFLNEKDVSEFFNGY